MANEEHLTLYARMREEKLRTWYAPEDMQGGRKVHEQIDQALRVHDKLLIVLSQWHLCCRFVRSRRKSNSHKSRKLFLAEYKGLYFAAKPDRCLSCA